MARAAVFGLAVTLLAWPPGLRYAAIYAVALCPGLPLGFALFGWRHPAGWVAGALLGYFVTSLAIWVAIASGHPSALAFTAGWVAAAAICVLSVARLRTPLIGLPHWRAADTRALLAVLIVVLAITVPPFANVGARDADGNERYRAYFTADFVWHAALGAEMAKFASPPRNPYLASRPVHYYWTYFLLPAAVSGVGGAAAPIATCLKVNAIATALLFASAVFIAAWTAVPRAGPVAAAVTLAIVASSAEGAFAALRLVSRGLPLSELRNLNIDAISSWWFSGLRFDGLQRCFWWVPQHSMAYALGLTALAAANAGGSAMPSAAIVLAGTALAGSVAMNP